jgi:hypothetical protein
MEKRKFFTLPGLELRPLTHPARSQSLYLRDNRLHNKEKGSRMKDKMGRKGRENNGGRNENTRKVCGRMN